MTFTLTIYALVCTKINSVFEKSEKFLPPSLLVESAQSAPGCRLLRAPQVTLMCSRLRNVCWQLDTEGLGAGGQPLVWKGGNRAARTQAAGP